MYTELASDPGEMLSVAAGPGGFVAVGRSDSDPGVLVVLTSPDGLRWRRVPSDQDAFVSHARRNQNEPVAFEMHSVAAGPSGYLVVGGDALCVYNVWTCSAAEAAVWTSEDGETWSRVPSAPVFRLVEESGRVSTPQTSVVAAWGARFIAAGNSGEGTDIWISEAPGEDS